MLHSFSSRLQEMNAYSWRIPPGVPGQETEPLPMNDVMDIIYYSMPKKNKMIE